LSKKGSRKKGHPVGGKVHCEDWEFTSFHEKDCSAICWGKRISRGEKQKPFDIEKNLSTRREGSCDDVRGERTTHAHERLKRRKKAPPAVGKGKTPYKRVVGQEEKGFSGNTGGIDGKRRLCEAFHTRKGWGRQAS